MRLSAIARAVSFAHLLGPAAKATESGEEEARRAEEEKEKEDARRAKRAKKAEEDKEGADDDGDDAGMDDDAEEDKKEPDDKDAEDSEDDVSAAEDDEIEDGDDKDKAKSKRSAAFRAGRLAERARCQRILGSAAAAGRPDLAAHLACNTGLSSSAAIATLKTAGPIGRGPSLHQRMAASPAPANPGAAAPPDRGGMTLADKMAAVRKKVGGQG